MNDLKKKQLCELASRYLDREEFQPGDVIYNKVGLRNRHFPDDGDPAVVIEIFSGKRLWCLEAGKDGGGSNHNGEPLDLRIGIIVPGGTFECFMADSSRFTKVKPEPGEFQ